MDHHEAGHGDHPDPVDHWVLDGLLGGEALDDLLDVPLGPPCLGEHQLYDQRQAGGEETTEKCWTCDQKRSISYLMKIRKSTMTVVMA